MTTHEPAKYCKGLSATCDVRPLLQSQSTTSTWNHLHIIHCNPHHTVYVVYQSKVLLQLLVCCLLFINVCTIAHSLRIQYHVSLTAIIVPSWLNEDKVFRSSTGAVKEMRLYGLDIRGPKLGGDTVSTFPKAALAWIDYSIRRTVQYSTLWLKIVLAQVPQSTVPSHHGKWRSTAFLSECPKHCFVLTAF
jgi:hypothetical protein